MLAVALAALPFKIAVAHLGRGDLTEGAVVILFAALHHKVKPSTLHRHYFQTRPQSDSAGRRSISCLFVTGEPALDDAQNSANVSPTVLEEQFGVDVKRPFLSGNLSSSHPGVRASRIAE